MTGTIIAYFLFIALIVGLYAIRQKNKQIKSLESRCKDKDAEIGDCYLRTMSLNQAYDLTKDKLDSYKIISLKRYYISFKYINKGVIMVKGRWADDKTATVKEFWFNPFDKDDIAFAIRNAEELIEKLEER